MFFFPKTFLVETIYLLTQACARYVIEFIIIPILVTIITSLKSTNNALKP